MRKIIFVGILVIIASGCQKQRVSRPSDATPKTFFGTTIADTNLGLTSSDVKAAAATPLKSLSPSSGTFTVSSGDWLDLSTHLIEVGIRAGGSDGDALVKSGHKLADDFYALPYSHTIMTATTEPIGNPYIDVAELQAKPVLVQKWSEAVDNVKTKVTAAAAHTTITLSDLPQDPLPEVVIQKVIDGLTQFKSFLVRAKDGNGDPIIDEIAGSIDTDYINSLQGLREASRFDKKVSLETSLQLIGQSLRSLSQVSESQRQRLLVSVNWGISLAQKTAALKQSQDAVVHLVNFWLNSYYRDMFPKTLKNLFKGLTDKQILALATSNVSSLFDSTQWRRVKARTDYILMPDQEIVAQYVQNNGTVLSATDWAKLKAYQQQRLDQLIQTKEVTDLINLISVNMNVTDLNEKRAVLINNWLGLSNRLCFPADLKAAFDLFSQQELVLLKSDERIFNDTVWLAGSGHPILAIAHHQLLNGLESFGAKPGESITPAQGLDNFKTFFENQIISATRTRMDHALVPIASTLSDLLVTTLIPLLDQQKASGDKIAQSSFDVYGRYYMGKLVFGAQGLVKGAIDDTSGSGSGGVGSDNDDALLAHYPLPILEKSVIKINRLGGSEQNLSAGNLTSAETLGAALTNNYVRLQTLAQAKHDDPLASSQSIGLNFQSIAKMLAIAGYTGADAHLTESLNAPMTPGHFGELLDIHHYDPRTSIFATPNQIIIKDQYKMDPQSAKNANISVVGQMRLLRGYAQMMRFFKPWMASAFDQGLGALRIDEAPTLQAFNKSDFFLLSIGLASIVLENIPVKMMGYITSDGDLIESGTVKDPSQVAAVGAVLANYTIDKMSHLITTHDMATSIEAVAEFYDVIRDLEKTEDPVLLSTFKANPPAAIRLQISKLLSGLVLFSTGRLMMNDGGFAVSYDGDGKKVSAEPRTLEDQLVMEHALLKAGTVLGSNFILARAADNFFFLNGHLWDAQLGFYKKDEISGQRAAAAPTSTVKLNDVVVALDNNLQLAAILSRVMTQSTISASLEQLQTLGDFWKARFLSSFLSNGVINDSSVNKVLEYSL